MLSKAELPICAPINKLNKFLKILTKNIIIFRFTFPATLHIQYEGCSKKGAFIFNMRTILKKFFFYFFPSFTAIKDVSLITQSTTLNS